MKTFANLPPTIEKTIESLLSEQDALEWVNRAAALHEKYLSRTKGREGRFLKDYADALAYLGMRVPATYAQIFGALENVQAVLPEWKPTTVLDIGSGPGTGIWAAHELYPELTDGTCLDQDRNLLTLGNRIVSLSQFSMNVVWKQQDIRKGITSDNIYDLVIVANVFNELSLSEGEKLLGQAYNACREVLLIVEPGTPFGSSIVQSAAQKLAHTGILIAPYIANAFVHSDEYWLHFSQKFIRPEFQRRIRQKMRDSSVMASDWEDTKYSYVAISKIASNDSSWGRCVGPVKLQKGFLEVPILTKQHITHVKVMKRHKEQYNFAKDLTWGQLIGKVMI